MLRSIDRYGTASPLCGLQMIPVVATALFLGTGVSHAADNQQASPIQELIKAVVRQHETAGWEFAPFYVKVGAASQPVMISRPGDQGPLPPTGLRVVNGKASSVPQAPPVNGMSELWDKDGFVFYKVNPQGEFKPLGDFLILPQQGFDRATGAYLFAGKHGTKVVNGQTVPDDDAVLASPVGFEWIADDKGSDNPRDLHLFVPRAPPGFRALGLCFVNSGEPNPADYWCVREIRVPNHAFGQLLAASGELLDKLRVSRPKQWWFGVTAFRPEASPPLNEIYLLPTAFCHEFDKSFLRDPVYIPRPTPFVIKASNAFINPDEDGEVEALDPNKLRDTAGMDSKTILQKGFKKRIAVLPFTAIKDSLSDQPGNSPFYFCAEETYWKCIEVRQDPKGTIYEIQYKRGWSKEESQSFKQTVNTTAKIEAGRGKKDVWGVKASFEWSKTIEEVASSSRKDDWEQSWGTKLTADSDERAFHWQKVHAYTVYRTDGSVVATVEQMLNTIVRTHAVSKTASSEPSTPTKQTGPPAILDLMKKLTPEYVRQIAGNDDALRQLLLVTFEGDWSKAKSCLLQDRWPVAIYPGTPIPSPEARLALMGELVRMRGAFCDAVVRETQSNLMKYLHDQRIPASMYQENVADAFISQIRVGPPEAHFKPLTPTGAQKLTSDIDVASSGFNTEFAVRLFNQTCRNKLHVDWDPATVFDCNVYAADWIFPVNFVEEKKDSVVDLTPRPEQVLSVDAGSDPNEDQRLQAEREEIFERAALLHLRRNCTDLEWEQYSRLREKEGSPLVTRLQVVNSQHQTYQAEIRQKEDELKTSLTKRASPWDEAWFDEELETRSRDQIYEERLMKVKALRLHYQVLKNKPQKSADDRSQMYTLAKQITQALTEALYFANEVYATEGATLHATQGIQKVEKAKENGVDLKVHLTHAQYLESIDENAGDALHGLTKYKNDPPYAAFRAGKYIDRMLLAEQALQMPPVIRDSDSYRRLKDITKKFAMVKSLDDPRRIAKTFQQEYSHPVELEQVRQAVLRFDAEIER